MKRAVLYLRSSKDQKDVSIQSQRHELTALAERRGLQLVGEYVDVVESAKEWDRPGFQDLLRAVRRPGRGWTVVLTKDTSRVARRRQLALMFEEQECARHGVEVCYANIPEGGDAATTMILRTLLQAMDEWHSLTSREKGLAGMAENVRRGFRAAGVAPWGYKLKKNETGIVRAGAAVTKSTLELSEDAPLAKRYLELRAMGTPRTQAARVAGVTVAESSLVGIEWNALTYAGCTTFGVFHKRTSSGAYEGRRKRRPRAEWQVQEATHQALITRGEAETILRSLETSDHAKATSAGRTGATPYLLSGLLSTFSGASWEVSRRTHYCAARAGGRKRYIPLQAIERGVLQQIGVDIRSEAWARSLLQSTATPTADRKGELKTMHRRIADLAQKIDRAATLALELEDPAPYQRKIEALERERRQLVEQQLDLQEEMRMQEATRSLRVPQMQAVLAEFAETIERADSQGLKVFLRGIVQRIEVDPDSLDCRIHYGIATAQPGLFPESLALLRKRPASRKMESLSQFRLTYEDGRVVRGLRSGGRLGSAD